MTAKSYNVMVNMVEHKHMIALHNNVLVYQWSLQIEVNLLSKGMVKQWEE